MKIMENNWLNLINLSKRILISTEIAQDLKKNISKELVEEKSSELKDLEERINPDNMIYKYKTEVKSPKYFRNYQNLIELTKNLRDDNVTLREG